MPIGLIGSLGICTIFYLLVAVGVIGTVGAQPVTGRRPASACAPAARSSAPPAPALGDAKVVCSKEALAWTLREIGWPQIGNLIGLAAGLALPSVILMMMFGQTRIFFVMSRDGLLPAGALEGAPEVPHAARDHDHHRHLRGPVRRLLPGGGAGRHLELGHAVRLRHGGDRGAGAAPDRPEPQARPFRTPAVMVVAPLAAIGCVYLFFSLSNETQLLFVGWAVDRPGGLLPLRLPQEPRGARFARDARAGRGRPAASPCRRSRAERT